MRNLVKHKFKYSLFFLLVSFAILQFFPFFAFMLFILIVNYKMKTILKRPLRFAIIFLLIPIFLTAWYVLAFIFLIDVNSFFKNIIAPIFNLIGAIWMFSILLFAVILLVISNWKITNQKIIFLKPNNLSDFVIDRKSNEFSRLLKRKVLSPSLF